MAGLIIFLFLLVSSPDALSLIIAIILHEAGHIIAAFFVAREWPRVSFSVAGIRMSYIGICGIPSQIAVSAAGPLVNILCGVIFWWHYRSFALYSIGLGIVNLLPVRCLDGGVILYTITDGLMSGSGSLAICKVTSVIVTLAVFALNCAIQLKAGTNLSLAIISVYLIYSVLAKEGEL